MTSSVPSHGTSGDHRAHRGRQAARAVPEEGA
jgi:hypothetical protein